MLSLGSSFVSGAAGHAWDCVFSTQMVGQSFLERKAGLNLNTLDLMGFIEDGNHLLLVPILG